MHMALTYISVNPESENEHAFRKNTKLIIVIWETNTYNFELD